MFKVVIVDDEPLIVRSVKSQIESLDEEFQVAASANDGMTALNVIEQVKPDLVFIDIAMPVMDGFQLLESLRKKENYVPVVILSGYQEFSYARKAIHLGVLDYLIKPLNPVTLGEFLAGLKMKLIQSRARMKKEALEAILRGNGESVQSMYSGKEQFYVAKICFGSYHFFRNNQFSVQEVKESEQKLRKIAERNMGMYTEWMLVSEKEENEFLLLFQTEDGYGKKKLYYIFEELKRILRPEEYVTFVTSEQTVILSEIFEEKKALESYLYHNNIFASSSYLVCAEQKETEVINQNRSKRDGAGKWKEPDYKTFRKYAEYQKEKELRELVHQTIVSLNEGECTQAVLSQILKQILQVCCRDTAEYEQYFMLNLVLCSKNYQELEEKFMEVLLEYAGITQMNSSGNAGGYSGADKIVSRIKGYLDEHYQEKIRIQDVAEMFGFNYSYMCHLFRKHTEISPNEYIIMKRIEYAKELLVKQKELSIRDLAEMSGYPDPYYFSRMFKSYTGMSPSDYKKQFS